MPAAISCSSVCETGAQGFAHVLCTSHAIVNRPSSATGEIGMNPQSKRLRSLLEIGQDIALIKQNDPWSSNLTPQPEMQFDSGRLMSLVWSMASVGDC
jgi:hypothetical protein